MIRAFAQCPYCDAGGLAIDDDKLEFVFTHAGPCPHLAFAVAGLSIPLGPEQDLGRTWLWIVGEGHLPPAPPKEGITNSIIGWVTGGIATTDPVDIEYETVEGISHFLDEASERLGHFQILREGKWLDAELNGWGVYSPDPMALKAALYEDFHASRDALLHLG